MGVYLYDLCFIEWMGGDDVLSGDYMNSKACMYSNLPVNVRVNLLECGLSLLFVIVRLSYFH